MALLRIKRFQSPQTLSYTSGARNVLTQGLEQALPLVGLDILLTGRLATSGGTTNGTFLAEALQNLINRLRIYGSRNDGKGNVTLYDVAGPEVFMQSVFYTGIWGRSQGITRLATEAAATNYDFLVQFSVPFVAQRVGIVDIYRTILDPSRFSTLQLDVTWGTQATAATGCLLSGGDRTLTFSAFGVGTGSPTLTYTLNQAILGGVAFGTHYLSRISRQSNLGNVGNVTRSTLTGADLPVGNMIKAIQLRQYSEESGFTGVVDQSGGAALFLGLPNVALTGITRVYLMRNSSIPDWEQGWNQLTDYNMSTFGHAVNRPSVTSVDDQGLPAGYALIDFCADSGSLEDAYDLRAGFPPSKLQVFIDSTGTASANRVDVLYQELVEWGA